MPANIHSPATPRRLVALAAAALLGAQLPAPAMAQTPPLPQAPAAGAVYELPAQALDQALSQLARQAGLQLLVRNELVKGRQAPALAPIRDLAAALQILLRGSGLRGRVEGSTLLVEKAPAESSSAETVLPVVRVTAAQVTETATGPVQGYVAKRSATATKTDTPIIETPQSISVVTRDQMDAQGVQQVSDTLRYSAGVVAEANGPDPRGEVFRIRGFDGGGASNIYLNGLRASGFENQGGIVLDPYGLERVELLRGPASVLYGQAGVGGLVNAVSKRPTDMPLHELQAQVGSYGRKQLAADFGGPLSDDGVWSYRLTGFVRDSDTQFDHISNDRVFIAPALTWRPNENTSLTLLSEYSKDKTGGSYLAWPRVGTLEDNPNGKIASRRYLGEPDFDKFSQERTSIGYAFEHAFDDALTFRQNFRHMDLRTDVNMILMSGLNADQRTVSRIAYQDVERVQNTLIDNQLQVKLAQGWVQHTALLGLDQQWLRNRVTASYGSVADLDVYAPIYGASPTGLSVGDDLRNVRTQTGVYLQDQIKIDGVWVATLGGRHDWTKADTTDYLNGGEVTQQKDSATTYRAGLVYLAPNGWAPYVSYAESFAPVMGRDFAAQAFKPETGKQYEAGVRYQPANGKVSLTASVFDSTRQNVTTSDPEHVNAQIQRGEVRSRGLELEAKAKLRNGLNVLASYAYTRARITQSNDGVLGNTPGAVPTHIASAWLDYAVPADLLPGLRLGLGARYLSATYGDDANTVRVPAYTLFDAALNYDFSVLGGQWKGWKLAVNVSNLFDKQYIATCGYYGDGCKFGYRRSATASLTHSW